MNECDKIDELMEFCEDIIGSEIDTVMLSGRTKNGRTFFLNKGDFQEVIPLIEEIKFLLLQKRFEHITESLILDEIEQKED